MARGLGRRPDARCRGKGKSAYELLDSLGPTGGIRALLVFGSNVAVASPARAARSSAQLGSLDLLVVCDAFLNETAALAHVVLPVAQWAEEDGTMTNLEGRVILRRRVARAAGRRADATSRSCARSPSASACGALRFSVDRRRRLRRAAARATAGGRADYSGITYEQDRRAQDGVFWPCPAPDHPGTPRLFAERFAHPDGRARFHAVRHRPAAEVPDADYPLYFTTGRYKEHYNSGAQTRRVARARRRQARAARCRSTRGWRHASASPTAASVLVESRRGEVAFAVDVIPGHPPGHAVRAVSLGRQAGRQPADHAGARSDEPHARVQGLRRARPPAVGRRASQA